MQASSKEGGRGGGSAGGSAMWPSTRDDGAPDMKTRFCLSGYGLPILQLCHRPLRDRVRDTLPRPASRGNPP